MFHSARKAIQNSVPRFPAAFLVAAVASALPMATNSHCPSSVATVEVADGSLGASSNIIHRWPTIRTASDSTRIIHRWPTAMTDSSPA